MSKTQLAYTWNGNESGTLWEGWWYEEDCKFFTSGTYRSEEEFANEKEFWDAYRKEARQFHGRIVKQSPQKGAA